MAAIIQSALQQTGLSAYAHIRDQNGDIWNGTTFEPYLLANYATYTVIMTEQVPTGYYKAPFPAAIAEGLYTFIVYENATPTAGDVALDKGVMDWSGSSENYVGLVVAKLPAGDISGFDPLTQNVNLNADQSTVTIGIVNDLGTLAAAVIKAQIDAALGTDVIPELLGVPAATPTLKQAIMFLYMALRNKRTSTNTTVGIFNNSGTIITSATQSDDGITYIKNLFT